MKYTTKSASNPTGDTQPPWAQGPDRLEAALESGDADVIPAAQIDPALQDELATSLLEEYGAPDR